MVGGCGTGGVLCILELASWSFHSNLRLVFSFWAISGGGSVVWLLGWVSAVSFPCVGVLDLLLEKMSLGVFRLSVLFLARVVGQPLVWDVYAAWAAFLIAWEALLRLGPVRRSLSRFVLWRQVMMLLGSIPSMSAAGRMAGCLSSCVPHMVRGLFMNHANVASSLIGLMGVAAVHKRGSRGDIRDERFTEVTRWDGFGRFTS